MAPRGPRRVPVVASWSRDRPGPLRLPRSSAREDVGLLAVVRETVGDAARVDVVPGWDPEDGLAVQLSGPADRSARLVLEGGWCHLMLQEPGVRTLELVDDGEVFEERAGDVRTLTRVAVSYVTGGGRLEVRRSRVLRRPVPVWVTTVEGSVWELSRRWSRSRPA